MAGEGDDSFEIGKKRFIHLEKADIGHYNQADKVYPEESWTKLSKEDGLCTFEYGGHDYKDQQISCIQQMKASCNEQASLVNKYQHLLDRYSKILSASEVKSPSNTSLIDMSTLTEFRIVGGLGNYERWHRHQCAVDVDKNKLVNEVNVLGKDLRAFKARADDFTTNIFLLVKLKEFYRWQVFAYRSGFEELHQLPTDFFELQTKEESGLRNVLMREIAWHAKSLDSAYQKGLSDAEDDWKTSLFFKKNLTINDSTLSYRQAILDSELPINRYVQERLSYRLKSFIKWWRITNILGEILSSVALPRFVNVDVDMNNLDLIIRLSDIAINHSELVDNNQLSSLPLSKRNPYDNSLPYFDESGKWLCFKVPEELDSKDECIYLN
ncbi:hypothetical protein [Neptuniibacter sp. QD34_54]|uniref:hypothetical protein n=1 Tax=unclassified Neptuniibacter TaxID=2630693 RepID=UPI0039F6AEA1